MSLCPASSLHAFSLLQCRTDIKEILGHLSLPNYILECILPNVFGDISLVYCLINQVENSNTVFAIHFLLSMDGCLARIVVDGW